jgi:signal transduction histidine kinase
MEDFAQPGGMDAVAEGIPAAVRGLSEETIRVLERVPSAVFVLDASGAIRWANGRTHRVLRRSVESVVGLSAEALLGCRLPPVSELPVGAEGYAGRATLPTPDGLSMTVSFRVTALELPGLEPGEGCRAVFVQDVTGIEHLRAERDRLLQFAAVHEVLPSLLHELKTPLASVLSSVELLVEDTPEGPMQAALYAVLLELRRMKLNLEGIGSVGRPLRSTRPHAIDGVVSQACLVLEANARSKGMTLRCHTQVLPLMPFDPSVVRAVVFNLVTNAIQACSSGDTITVTLGLDASRSQLVLVVDDTGCGMSAETLARCRDLFFTTKSNGSGLGLALCDAAARAADGSLTLRSAPGRGTVATLCVPLNVGRMERAS